MCCFCCTSLRGTVYFMITVHIIGALYMSIRCLHAYLDPSGIEYPDLNINPMIISQLPLLLSGYAFINFVYGCFIFRAVDMDSVVQMKWSVGTYMAFQLLVIVLQFVFNVMFIDILTKSYQAVMVGLLVVNFLITVVYICVLSLYGKKLHSNKFKRPKLYRNSLHQNDVSIAVQENNWDIAAQTLRKETISSNNRLNVNLLETHETPVPTPPLVTTTTTTSTVTPIIVPPTIIASASVVPTPPSPPVSPVSSTCTTTTTASGASIVIITGTSDSDPEPSSSSEAGSSSGVPES